MASVCFDTAQAEAVFITVSRWTWTTWLTEVSEWLSVWLSLAVFDVACTPAVWRSVLADGAVAMDLYIWAIQAGLLTPLTFARHRLIPLAAFTSGAYFLHNGRR